LDVSRGLGMHYIESISIWKLLSLEVESPSLTDEPYRGRNRSQEWLL
jgi:hypothetical protein